MVNMLVAAAVAAATPASAPPAQPMAEPAMFVVRDADTTVYIFGTFHALDGKAQWLNDRVKNAFEQSDELILETLVPERPAPIPLPGPGFKPPSVTPSASFLATTRMAINAGRSRGMQVGNGADMVLRRLAESEGKPVEGLETLESQLSMFTRMPAAAAAPAPRPGQPVGAKHMEGLQKAMTDMQSAWKRCDQSVFVNLLSQLRTSSPDT